MWTLQQAARRTLSLVRYDGSLLAENSFSSVPPLPQVDVFLSQSLANHLYIFQVSPNPKSISQASVTMQCFQYPLRPAHLPFDPNGVLGARMRPEQQKVELDVAIHPRGENYSSSRGDQYAQMIELGKGSTSSSERYYERHVINPSECC